jgi:hypothetical protein
MAGKRLWIAAPFVVLALLIYAVHTYEERQAYKTGIYIGKAAFKTQDFQNRQCLRVRGDSFQRVCKVTDLNKDSVMEDALASANVIPALSDSTALHTGFRDGWREARTAAFANR